MYKGAGRKGGNPEGVSAPARQLALPGFCPFFYALMGRPATPVEKFKLFIF